LAAALTIVGRQRATLDAAKPQLLAAADGISRQLGATRTLHPQVR
jgi:hypothetical protein